MILHPVIDELHLVDKWSAGLSKKLSEDEAYHQLLEMIDVKQKGNTDMVTIAVTSTDPQEAADIANTVAVIYQKKRRDDLDQQIISKLQNLKVEVDSLRQKAEEAKAELERIRLRDNVLDPSPDVMEANDMEAQRRMLVEEQRLNEAKQKVEDWKKQLDAADGDTRTKLQGQLDAAQADLNSEQKIYDAAKIAVEKASSTMGQDYLKAKQDYLKAKKLLDEVERRYNELKMSMQITLIPAEVWDRAEKPQAPSGPDVRLIMTVAVVAGFLSAMPGVALLLIGVRLRRGEESGSSPKSGSAPFPPGA